MKIIPRVPSLCLLASAAVVSAMEEHSLPFPHGLRLRLAGQRRCPLLRIGLRIRSQVIHSGPIRVRVDFVGARPEDIRLHAVYATPLR